jgi:hypothetical protein
MRSPLLARVVEEADARQLPAVIDEWWDAADLRRWLARALRIDLALLTERPELVLPCLHRRCAWLGEPAEAAFYRGRPEPPPDAAALRDLVGSWRPGRPWLRSLRPPQIPLDGGVLEEYRTPVRGDLRLSDDAAIVAVIGADAAATATTASGSAHAAAWDRASGRLALGARSRPPAPPLLDRWRLGLRDRWSRLVLEGEDRRLVLEIDRERAGDHDDNTVRSARQLTDDLVLAAGNHFHCLVDVAAGQIRWIARGGVEAAALLPDGERLCRAGGGGLELASLATGATLAAWAAPYVRQIVPAADGTIATLSAGVVRIWDPAVAARAPARLPAMDGDTPAQLSPDETRLVTGRLLCDARTGAALATLDVRTAPWLDGIRFDYQCLTDGGFAEILPFPPGLRLWSSRDGSLLVSDPARTSSMWDALAFDPTGAKYAVIPNAGFGGRHLRVHELRSGALVLALDDVRPASDGWRFALGFSPDGAHLWWETDAGDRFVLPLSTAPPSAPPRRLAPSEPLPRSPEPLALDVPGGILTLGDAAIPYDDERALASADGRTIAYRTSHYVLEDP